MTSNHSRIYSKNLLNRSDDEFFEICRNYFLPRAQVLEQRNAHEGFRIQPQYFIGHYFDIRCQIIKTPKETITNNTYHQECLLTAKYIVGEEFMKKLDVYIKKEDWRNIIKKYQNVYKDSPTLH